jgi:hypothetical protein
MTDVPLTVGSWTVPGLSYSNSRLSHPPTDSIPRANCSSHLSTMTTQRTPIFIVVVQLLPWEYICLRSRYAITAVTAYLLISRWFPSNGSTCHNILGSSSMSWIQTITIKIITMIRINSTTNCVIHWIRVIKTLLMELTLNIRGFPQSCQSNVGNVHRIFIILYSPDFRE